MPLTFSIESLSGAVICMEATLFHIGEIVLVGEPKKGSKYSTKNWNFLTPYKGFLRFYKKANFLIREVWKTLLPNYSVFNFEIGNSKWTDSGAECTPGTYFSTTSFQNLNIFSKAGLSWVAPRYWSLT